jgi:hypothetical protein
MTALLQTHISQLSVGGDAYGYDVCVYAYAIGSYVGFCRAQVAVENANASHEYMTPSHC